MCDTPFFKQARDIMSHADTDVEVRTIASGKIRRYHGVSLFRQLLDIPTTLRNIRDMFLVLIGVIQSIALVLKWKPDVIFTKGGFVCLPVGIAAKVCSVPLVIHESDSHSGLTNKILARWATFIATGTPLENYTYPPNITSYVGIPVDTRFSELTPESRLAAKHAIGMVDVTKPLVVVTGGGLGAKRINDMMTLIGDSLIDQDIYVFHVTGMGQFDEVVKNAPESVQYMITPFIYENMHEVLGAADVVVTRAGATTLLELASLAVATIIIPNPLLTGGHQTKNAAVYEKAHAAVIVDETESDSANRLEDAIMGLIRHPEIAKKLGKTMHQFAKPDAAIDVASLIARAYKMSLEAVSK